MNGDDLYRLCQVLGAEEDSNLGNEVLIDAIHLSYGIVVTDQASPDYNAYLLGKGA